MPASPDQENLNVGIGYTIVDTLSTLLIMSHSHPESFLPAYRRGKSWVRTNLDFSVPRDQPVSVFETTIRVLAGLLSADWLERDYFKLEPEKVYSGEKQDGRVLLNMASDLAWRLSAAFNTPSGVPLSLIDLRLRKGVKDPDPENKGLVSTAEVGTLQLEFRCVCYVLWFLAYEEYAKIHLNRL
jgi:mannosyl-oligosaccharide alpha-1,2-mannosidase